MLEFISWVITSGLVPHFILLGITIVGYFFIVKWLRKQDKSMKRKD